MDYIRIWWRDNLTTKIFNFQSHISMPFGHFQFENEELRDRRGRSLDMNGRASDNWYTNTCLAPDGNHARLSRDGVRAKAEDLSQVTWHQQNHKKIALRVRKKLGEGVAHGCVIQALDQGSELSCKERDNIAKLTEERPCQWHVRVYIPGENIIWKWTWKS